MLELPQGILNPSNVVVSRAGAVKLIDFGIARGETRVHETATGTMKGTLGYMAPEQLSEREAVDRRTDVFALGVILYELFVGTQPFKTKNLLELSDVILEGRYRPPRVARPQTPAGIAELVTRCLAPSPDARPQDMGEVADELQAFLAERCYVPTLRSLADLVERLVPAEASSDLLSRAR